MDQFIGKFNAVTAAVQGSGWGWLVGMCTKSHLPVKGYNKSSKRLEIATTSNQDPLVTLGLTPLLGIDVWEHGTLFGECFG